MFRNTSLTQLLIIIACVSVLAACNTRGNLPPLADVDTSKMLENVAAQLDTARQAVEASPNDADLAGRYGLALATYGRDEAADIAFRRARTLAPERPRWAFYHAFVLRRMGQSAEAMKAVDAGLASRPDQIDLLVKKAELLFDLARFDEAAPILDGVLTRNPRYPLAQFYKARIYSQNQQWDKAISEFLDMLSKGVQASEVHFQLATALRAKGDLKGVAEQQQLADAKSRRKIIGYDPAIMKMNEYNVGDAPHVVRAGELYTAEKVQEAIDELLEAIRKNPDNAGAHTHLVRMYGHQRKVDDAREHFEQALKIDTALPQIYSNLGFAYQMDNQHEAAAKAYRQAIALNPDNAGNYAELGYALARTGHPEDALNQFSKSLELQPVNRDLRYVYGRLLLSAKKLPEAIQMLNSAREPADQKGVVVLRTLAEAHVTSGNKQAGLEMLELAVKLAQSFQNIAMAEALQADIEKVKVMPDLGN